MTQPKPRSNRGVLAARTAPGLLILVFLVALFLAILHIQSSQAGFSSDTVLTVATQDDGEEEIFLPFLVNQYPLTPGAPTLNPISNADGDGNYTVTWSTSAGAASYTLQEDDNDSFSSPLTAYSGAGASANLSGRGLGTYYYRVRASSPSSESEWSNTVAVVVTQLGPACPQSWAWRGATSQGKSIIFGVDDSPSCQIADSSLRISFTDGCGAEKTTVFGYAIPIEGNHFDSGLAAGTRVIGDFTSPTTASGTFSYESDAGTCKASGAWTAAYNLGANGTIYALAQQSDGKIVVGGAFTTLGGLKRSNIGRLNADGSLDTAFNPGADGVIYALAVQTDDKIVVGGNFDNLAGAARSKIARLNPDGTLDSSFNPVANEYVTILLIQPDGKILVAGNFTLLNGVTRNRLGRLNENGSLDTGFVTDLVKKPNTIALQADEKILLGYSSGYNSSTTSVLRYTATGSLDTSFIGSVSGAYMDTHIYAVQVQPDGKVVAGGNFSSMAGVDADDIGRYTSTASFDPEFTPGTETGWVRVIALQPDNKILMGGAHPFTYIGHLKRLMPDGTVDATFIRPSVNREVYAILLQPDGKIVVAGAFSSLAGEPHYSIGRLNANGTIDASFVP